ncbi:MAG: hypothetical protein JW757_10500 [Anaerolineales bacterium]|nr:hypothetical protein [Anaerolineales bacterium]
MTIKVYPGVKRPTHQISLSDGVQTWGLRLENGPRSINEIPVTPSTVHFSEGGTKFGDWEPGMSHIEQRTWEGGRANDSFVDDATRYADGKMAWTLTPGKVFPVPNWKFSKPDDLFSEGYQNLPGDLGFISMYAGANAYAIAHSITCSSAWDAYDSVWLWLRRVGSPGSLSVRLNADNSGTPGTQLKASTLSASDYNENELYLVKVDMSGGSATIGTTIWIYLVAGSSDDAANHWEIGVDVDGGGSKEYDRAGGGWGNAVFSLYYRLLSAVEDRKFRFFEFRGALYAVDQQADGGASNLYINGDRGVATSAIGTTLVDSNKLWTADEWIGDWVKIVAGTGAGQSREITDNDATSLTVAAWDINPSTDSEYVIYHTDIWQDITPSSGDQIDAAVVCLAVLDSEVLFGYEDVVMLRMRWNEGGSPPAHEFDDSSWKAELLVVNQSSNEQRETEIYRFRTLTPTASHFGRAEAAQAWGTDYQFGPSIKIGSTDTPINGALAHNGMVYAFKPDGRYLLVPNETEYYRGIATAGAAASLTDSGANWPVNGYAGYYVEIEDGTGEGQVRAIASNTATALTVAANWSTNPSTDSVYRIYKYEDYATKQLGEIGFTQSENNGEAVLSHGLYSYFSWGGYAVQRLYDASGTYDLSNIGPDKDNGLPDDRRGKCVKLLGTPPGIMAAIQSDGYSSVLVQPQGSFGWHEVFRGWASGAKIEEMYIQDSYRPRLWLSVGGEIVYQDWPRHTFNPLKDSGMTYYPEAHLVSSTIDMGVSRLPKLIKEISAAVENLSSDVEVHLDYQVNEDVGTDSWIYAGVFRVNPADTLTVNEGEVYQIRYRLRLVTKDEDTPPIVNATVLEGFARTPVKYQWNMCLKVSGTQRDLSGVGYDHDPDDFVTWLKEAATSSSRIYMRSVWEQLDGKYVVVEPPSVLRMFQNDILNMWGGTLQLTLREI